MAIQPKRLPICSRPTCTVASSGVHSQQSSGLRCSLTLRQTQIRYRSWRDIEDDQHNQRQLHRLRLVCKQFNEIFAAQPLFVRRLSLREAFPSSSLPSLLTWLQQNKSCLEVFEANCSSHMADVFLSALTSSTSQLKLIDIGHASTACSVQLLGSFSSLEMCALSSAEGDLHLTPSQALPKLRSLWLAGSFDGLASLRHLTHLRCYAATIDCSGSCNLMTALQHLDMKNTTLENSDDRGLSICQGLRKLTLQKSKVTGAHSVLYAADHSYTPVGMSLFTNLARLSLTCNLRTAGPISLAWISELTTLQDLYIRYTTIDSGLIKKLACLSSLARLVVSGYAHLADVSPTLNLDFGWCSLTALKQFSLCHSRFAMGPGTASLLRLQLLTEIAFHNGTLQAISSIEHYAALIHSFTTLCLQVRLHLNTSAMEYFLEYGKDGIGTGQH